MGVFGAIILEIFRFSWQAGFRRGLSFFRSDQFGTGGVEGIFDFPFVHVLAYALGIAFVAHRDFFLRPQNQAFKIEFVSVSNHDIGDLLIFNGSSDGLRVYAKQLGGLGNGQSDDAFGFFFLVLFHICIQYCIQKIA